LLPNFSYEEINALIGLAKKAGDTILEIFQTKFKIREKIDRSPVTEADERAENIILTGLAEFAPDIPALGEESYSAGIRPDISGGTFWLIDALDGTKAFVDKCDEFTVNIALIERGIPIFGVVHAPAISRTFWGSKFGAFCKDLSSPVRSITTRNPPREGLTVVTSHAHRNGEDEFLAKYKVKNTLNIGSSLKICLIAAGEADIYPRLGPTSEWDIAAGHAILIAAGGSITQIDGSPFLYGKKNILNPFFVAKGK